jgi:Mrp family chromosome partitioning ATPase
MGRLRRGVRRQWLIVLLITLAVTGTGIAYDLAGGIRPLSSATFWLPIGLSAALVIALVREVSRNTITMLSSLGKHRGYTVLGAAPDLTAGALRELPPDKRTPLGALAFQQASPFATAFRDLQAALRDDNLVAFVGSVPNEGATTAALCTAVSAAQQGRSVIVVDCDVRRRSLTKALGSEPDLGVLEACEQSTYWRTYVEEEPETGVHVLPAARLRNPWRNLVGTPGFPQLITALRKAYDLVVLDCPPALGSAEGAIIAGLADKVVTVAAWDRTPISAVRNTIRTLQKRSRAATAVYVNRVPPGYRFGRLRPD